MRRFAVDALLYGSDLSAFAAAGYLAARGRTLALVLPGGPPLPECAALPALALPDLPGDAALLPRTGLVTAGECAAGRVDSAPLLERAAALLAVERLFALHGALPVSAVREGARLRSASFATPRFPFKVRARFFADFCGTLARAAGVPAEGNDGRQALRLLPGADGLPAALPALPRPDQLLNTAREALAACRLARAAAPAGAAPPAELVRVECPRGLARYGAPAPGAPARLAFGPPAGPRLGFALAPHRAAGACNLLLFGLATPCAPEVLPAFLAPRDRLLSGLLAGATLERLLALRRAEAPLDTADVEREAADGPAARP